MTHKLKSWPSYFTPVMSGDKTFEIRRNDRGFHVGDTLLLQEWEPETKHYTGREVSVKVTYIVRASADNPIAKDFCVMAIHL